MRNRSIVVAALLIVAALLAFALLPTRGRMPAAIAPAPSAREPMVLRVASPPRTARLSGKVTTAHGAMRGPARVCATCANCEITGTSDQLCTDTDAAGAYALVGLGASGYRITAAARGYAIASANQGRLVFLAPGAQRDGVDIVLAAAGDDVAGEVLDATGGPVAAARVRLVTWAEKSVVTDLISDAEGRFAASVAPGRVTVIANAAGYAPARVLRFAPTRDVTIVLTPEASLAGKVQTLGDERPVAGARVRAFSQSNMGEAISAADGGFRIDGLEPGRYVVTATAPGFHGAEGRTVELALGMHVDDVRVLVEPAVQVSGRVVVGEGASEQPCEQGMVMLGPPHPAISLRAGSKWTSEALSAQEPAPTTLTAAIGAQGGVHFDAVPPGNYFASVLCDGHLQQDGPDTVKVEAKDVEGLVWHVAASTRLSILVLDARDQPVPGANVSLRWPSSPSQSGAITPLEAGADGRTETVSHLYPGVYTATAAGGYESDPITLELPPGAREVEGTLRLKGSGVLEVDVRDQRGEPIDDVRVLARPCEPEAEPLAPPAVGAAAAALTTFSSSPLGGGRYRIAPLTVGCYRVEAGDDVSPAVEARSGKSGDDVQVADAHVVRLRVMLNRSATIAGRVLADDGSPLEDVWVSALASGKATDPIQQAMQRGFVYAANRVLTDREGRFSIAGLDPAATYDVKAEQPEGASTIQRAVAADQTVTLAMPATGAIEGTVSDAHGQAIDDFTLRVTEAETQRTESRDFQHSAGRFALGGITPGRIEIHAIDPSGQAAHIDAELKSGQRLTGLRLTLPDLKSFGER